MALADHHGLIQKALISVVDHPYRVIKLADGWHVEEPTGTLQRWREIALLRTPEALEHFFAGALPTPEDHL